MIENEYRYNSRFRCFVDGYAAEHGLTVEEALKHRQVREAFQHYREL